jgi:antitoxin PrlF
MEESTAMREIVSAVTRKGQVTIPAAVRKHIGIGVPDKIAFVLEDDGQVVIRPAVHTLRSVRGVVPPLRGRSTTDFEDQIVDAMEEEAARIVAEVSA